MSEIDNAVQSAVKKRTKRNGNHKLQLNAFESNSRFKINHEVKKQEGIHESKKLRIRP